VNYTVSMTVLSVECRHRPTRHSLGHFGDDIFTGLMTQPTVSKQSKRRQQ